MEIPFFFTEIPFFFTVMSFFCAEIPLLWK